MASGYGAGGSGALIASSEFLSYFGLLTVGKRFWPCPDQPSKRKVGPSKGDRAVPSCAVFPCFQTLTAEITGKARLAGSGKGGGLGWPEKVILGVRI